MCAGYACNKNTYPVSGGSAHPFYNEMMLKARFAANYASTYGIFCDFNGLSARYAPLNGYHNLGLDIA